MSSAATGQFALSLRIPEWAVGEPVLTLDGRTLPSRREGDLLVVDRIWSTDTLQLTIGTRLEAVALPDQPGTVAFVDGGVVLAGLVDDERRLVGDLADLDGLLQPDEERRHSWWSAHTWRTTGQDRGVRFIPLNEITDEAFSVYFPVKESQ